MPEKKSIMLYLNALEQWEMLSDEQAGVLIKAILRYGKDGEQFKTDDGMVAMAYSFITKQLDIDNEKYIKVCEKNAENIRKRWNKNNTTVYDRIPNDTNYTDKDKDKDKEKDTDKEIDKDTDKPQKHKFGEFNHVRLTEDEYSRLCEDYGKDTADYYIKKVDEYCEMKGKTYKNFNLAIRNTFMARDNIRKVERPSDKPDEELSVQEQIFRKLRC